jgi:O-acetyl-ADP-ribose deacetylase (regulator of RNase III)
MIVKYIAGNIVKIFLAGGNIAHGCNCFCTMGAGVAGQLAKAYPPIYAIDAESAYGDEVKLGTFTQATGKFGQICFNLYTQYEPGPNLDYGALVNCMIELNEWGANKINSPVIYMPRIGCGIAGGDWEKVSKLIGMFTPNLEIVIVDWDGN